MPFTRKYFKDFNPTMLIQFIPLGMPYPRNTTILHDLVKVLTDKYGDLLVDYEQGTIVLNTDYRKVPR